MKVCKVDGCNRVHSSLGYCAKHYVRFHLYGDPLFRKKRHGDGQQWIIDHILYSGGECLTWPFDTEKGYGRCSWEGKMALVSRVMCGLVHGPAPTPEHEAAHSCGNGNKGCVSPRHLSWKTKTENEADKRLHGTIGIGENNSAAKLTEADVMIILSLRGQPRRVAAERFGIALQTVSAIWHGQIWNHIERPKP